MVRITQLDDEMVDLLLSILSGVLPNTRLVDLRVETKGHARAAVRSQYMVKMKANQSRLTIMSEELGNLPVLMLSSGQDEMVVRGPIKESP